MPSADVDRVRGEIEDIIGIVAEDCPAVSAKVGLNIDQVLDAIVEQIPAPKGDPNAPLKCLIFDSHYNSYLGVVVYVRVMDGTLKAGDTVLLMSTGAKYEVVDVGHLNAFGLEKAEQLSAGEVGYITASIKTVSETRVGDTVTLADNPTSEPLKGFKEALPMVFSGIYPADGARYNDLRDMFPE